jgi:hypothetical protein
MDKDKTKEKEKEKEKEKDKEKVKEKDKEKSKEKVRVKEPHKEKEEKKEKKFKDRKSLGPDSRDPDSPIVSSSHLSTPEYGMIVTPADEGKSKSKKGLSYIVGKKLGSSTTTLQAVGKKKFPSALKSPPMSPRNVEEEEDGVSSPLPPPPSSTFVAPSPKRKKSIQFVSSDVPKTEEE